MTGWRNNFLRALAERAVPAGTGAELLQEAELEAAERGLGLEEVFGPATAYADRVARALRVPPAAPLAVVERSTAALRLTGVSKRYRRRDVLTDITLEVRHGESVAVVGANGSGKSTLLRICAGTVRPDAGTVERVEHVGYVPQSGGTAEFLTAGEHFELFAAARPESMLGDLDRVDRVTLRRLRGWASIVPACRPCMHHGIKSDDAMMQQCAPPSRWIPTRSRSSVGGCGNGTRPSSRP